MFRSVVITLALCLVSVSANAALFTLEYMGLAKFGPPSACRDYIYDCPDTVSLVLTFDTSTYASLSTNGGWSSTADEGRLGGFRATGMSITSLILRADDRILLNDATGLTFSVSPDGRGTTSTSGCNCIVSIGSADDVTLGGYAGYERIFQWPMIADLGADPVATVLLSIHGSGSRPLGYVTQSFRGDWGTLGSAGSEDDFGISPIPISSAVWLFGSALGLMGWMRRKVSG